VVYGLNRLSEDLDLDNSHGADLSALNDDLMRYIRNTMDYEGAAIKTQRGEKGILRHVLKFPVLGSLGLSAYPNESLHMKLEISTHQQKAIIKKTPVFFQGRSFVPAHFSLETMMAGKMLACLEHEFNVGKSGVIIKGRDFYDLLWFMGRKIQPLEEKLAADGKTSYTVEAAFLKLKEKIESIKPAQLAQDLNPLFESRGFIDAWVQTFHETFLDYLKYYI
jgi:hypothetical protein